MFSSVANWADLGGTEGEVYSLPSQGSWSITQADLTSGQLLGDVDMQFPRSAHGPRFRSKAT